MYKVVRNQNGELSSCIVGSRPFSSDKAPRWETNWRVIYIPNKWTKAKKGNIFLFKCLNYAEIFVKSYACKPVLWEIWRCQTRKAKVTTTITIISEMSFRNFWSSKEEDRHRLYYTTSVIPSGTYEAAEVKLTKKVR